MKIRNPHCILLLHLIIIFSLGRDGIYCSSLTDNPVFSADEASNVGGIQVGVKTTEELPAGHMKMLGEHSNPLPTSITELDYMISGKDFYQHFARKRRPVIFRGVTRNWISTKQWKNESYLLEKYSEVLFDVETGKVYDGALNTRKTMTMQDFLASYRKESWYLDSPFPQSPMMADMELPLMLQCEERYKSFESMHLLHSNGNTSSPLHHDGYENFLSVFSGYKVVYLMEPKYGKDMYVEFVEDFPGLSPINPEHVDLLKYPLFKDVPFYKVVINPGDMLYIPQFWYHQVRSYETPNIAASMWFVIFQVPDLASLNYRDVLNIEQKFGIGVTMAPETLNCEHQNRNMQEVQNVDVNLRDFPEDKKIDDAVNNVTLYDEVRSGQPILYAGSDDSYIYAVDMVDGHVKWKLKTEQDTGSMCAFNFDGSLVYCGADDGRMRAMFTRNGTLKWHFTAGGSIISSVVLDEEGNLYFGCLDYYMYSITQEGQIRWKRFLGYQIWSTPLLMDEILFIAVKNDELEIRNNVYALDMRTGSFVWRANLIAGIIATPRLDRSETVVYFCTLAGEVVGLSVLDGQIVFKESFNDTGELWASPAIDNEGVLYILLGSGRLIALDTVTAVTLWEINLKKYGHSESNSTHEDRGSNSSPLLGFDGILYVGDSNGIVYAIQPVDGKIIWQKRISSGIFFSSPRLSKDRILYIGSIDGPLYALDAKDDGKILWSMPTAKAFVGTALITRGFL